ncbi:thioredoxin-disulfide reductase [Treponema sp. Marseille-Q3903]|uniref:thioredoxin-disulfide reductase n=1 Tax=Treponema sp. Marseille-Q3903 TaxID=2766703 RepID=UPI001652AC04|nr:thioredoxin-disulfide reductase [Treponema sp. Marseille-Q3903]MBC6714357.1 thioredoxin-disulfide reductase [Treponema sp. Marseille-Q3903]
MENIDIEEFDYIIIGAGAAGLASAQYAARGGLKTVILEGMAEGGQIMQITELENYPGVFPVVNGIDFIKKMREQAVSFGAEIQTAQVLSIDKIENKFVIKTKNKTFTAPFLCIATGAVHRNLEVPGEKELTGRGVSYCAVCDGPFFRNKKIVVIGGGDSACSEATYLSSISGDVSIIHRRDSFRAQKSVIDKMLAAGVKPIYDTVVESINGSNKVESVTLKNVKTGETSEFQTDAVFIFTGMIPQTELVGMLPKDDTGYLITDENMETSMPGLFAAGDVRSKPFRQIVTAVADGAIAALTVASRVEN